MRLGRTWYHGTALSSPFRTFRPARGDHPSKVGIWLTDSLSAAIGFARSAVRMTDDTPYVVEVEVDVVSTKAFSNYSDYLRAWRGSGSDSKRLRRTLLREGFDSVLIVESDTDDHEARSDLAVLNHRDVTPVAFIDASRELRRNRMTPAAAERAVKRVAGAGDCYPAAEAIYHAAGGKKSGLTPVQVEHEGQSHWFVRDDKGRVYDPTSEQFRTPVPYDEGVGRGFLTKKPSRRGRAMAREAGVKVNPRRLRVWPSEDA